MEPSQEIFPSFMRLNQIWGVWGWDEEGVVFNLEIHVYKKPS